MTAPLNTLLDSLNPTPTPLLTGADKVPFYNTSDGNSYTATMDQIQTFVLAGGTIDPTFDDVTCDTLTATGNISLLASASGPVTIGVTNTSTNAAATARLEFGSLGGNWQIENRRTGGVLAFTFGTDRMLLDASGNLLVGTTSGSSRLSVVGSGATPAAIAIGPSGTSVNYFDANIQVFRLGNQTETWRINDSGHFFAGVDNTCDIGASGANRPRNIFIGNAATVATRIIIGSTALSASSNYGTPQFGTASDAFSSAHVESHNDSSGNYSFFGLMRSRGTRAAPTHVVANDPIGVLSAQVVQDTATSQYRESAGIQFDADGNHSSTSLPGRIIFRTTAVNATATTERMRLDASGNLGIGVTPSAWVAFSAFQAQRGSFAANTGEVDISHNAFYDGAWKYIANGFATNHYQTNGTYVWRTAASGTAGNAITFTQAMTLDASSNLGVGTASPLARLHANGNIFASTLLSGTGSSFSGVTIGVFGGDANGGAIRYYSNNSFSGDVAQVRGMPANYGVSSAGFLAFHTNSGAEASPSERWRINPSGHFLAGVDNTYDIGASGATRPRTVYAGTSVEGGYIRAGAASAGAASTTTIGNGTATTVGAAGGASALPATPLGYIIAHVGATQVKIPYYNN